MVSESSSQRLKGVRLLVTRPAHQSEEILTRLRTLGAQAVGFPTIEIFELTAGDSLIKRMDEYALAIFISGNAVHYGFMALARVGVPYTDLPPVVAIGRGTAKLLESKGVANVQCPEHPSSDSLLQMPVVKSLEPSKKVILFRGLGGKEVIAVGLRACELEVYYAEVYERCKPASATLSFADFAPDLILMTSRDGLQNLYDLTDSRFRAQLLKTPILLGSQSMLDLYEKLGFQQDAVIAKSPLDDDMVDAVLEWGKR